MKNPEPTSASSSQLAARVEEMDNVEFNREYRAGMDEQTKWREAQKHLDEGSEKSFGAFMGSLAGLSAGALAAVAVPPLGLAMGATFLAGGALAGMKLGENKFKKDSEAISKNLAQADERAQVLTTEMGIRDPIVGGYGKSMTELREARRQKALGQMQGPSQDAGIAADPTAPPRPRSFGRP